MVLANHSKFISWTQETQKQTRRKKTSKPTEFHECLAWHFSFTKIFLGTDDLESSQGFDEIRSLTIRLRWSLCHLCALGPVMMVDSLLGWILFRVGCESQTGMVDMIQVLFFFQVNVQESANSVHSWSDLARWQTWEDLDFLKCTRWWIFKMHFFLSWVLGTFFFCMGFPSAWYFLDHRRLPHPTDPGPTGSIGCSCRGPNQESHGVLCCSLVDQTGWLVTPRDLVGGIFSKSGVNYR